MVKLKPMIRRSLALAPSWATSVVGNGRDGGLLHTRKYQKTQTRGSFRVQPARVVLSSALVIGIAFIALGAVFELNHRFVVRIRVRPQQGGGDASNAAAAVPLETFLRSVEKRVQELLPGQHADSIIKGSEVDCARLLEDNGNGLFGQSPERAKSIQQTNRQQRKDHHALERIWIELLEALGPGPQEASDAGLVQPRPVIVVDVNAGSGNFSLMGVVAAAKRESSVKAYAFEANPLKNWRICESLESAESGDTFKMFSVGVGSHNVQDVPYRIPRARPLDASFEIQKVPALPSSAEDVYVTKSIIALDAWAASEGFIVSADELHQHEAPSPAIMILRIGGTANLLQVLQGAQQLLSRKAVAHIFCELSARSNLDSAMSLQAVSAVLEAGYRLVRYGDVASGPIEHVRWKHDNRLVGNLVDTAQRRETDKALSLWFQLPGVALPQRNVVKSGIDALVPLQCETFVTDALSGGLGFEDPNLGMDRGFMKQHVSHTPPLFWISLHNKEFDHPRWGIKTTGRYYKTQLEKLWRQILSDASVRGAHVIDVGSNIGYFTLLSMAMGDFVVHAFEPNAVNFLRLCESLQLNRWTSSDSTTNGARLLAYDAGVSDRDDVLPFQANNDNPGASKFLDATAPDFQYQGYVTKTVVSLDSYAERQGWLEPPPATAKSKSSPIVAILKIDVEGMEHRVLSGAAKLLGTHIVQNVFLELSVKDMQESLNSNMALSTLLQAGYELAGIGNWAGPGQPVPWKKDDPNLVTLVLEEAERQDSKQLHVWFKVKG